MGDMHMIQLALSARQLVGLARAMRLPRWADLGYLSHCAMKEAFADFAPSPFAITRECGDQVWIQGYGPCDWEQMLAYAQGVAPVNAYKRCLMEHGASKPMPQVFPTGVRLGFDLRACPVKRRTHEGRRTEVDAYQSACWRAGEGVTLIREVVYEDWLKQRFAALEACSLVDVRVSAFELRTLCRRTERKGEERRAAKKLMRPDVLYQGILEVKDGAAMTDLLRHGVGRHKAFGFGMLRVRRL